MFSVFIARVWAKVWPYIALVAAAFAAFFGIRQAGKAAGKAEVERKQTEAVAVQRGKINEADTKLSKMADDDIRAELRRWVRPDDS